MLELFHHLHDELPTHIVYSVDLNQLSSIIKHHYGYEYNVDIFTHKVFDEVINLHKLTENVLENYIDNIFMKSNIAYKNRELTRLIMIHGRQQHLESLRTINKLCDKLIIKLNTGFLKNYSFNNYFLGEADFVWGYVELLIILEIISLENPLMIYSFLRGENMDELLKVIENRELSIEMKHLIKESYNYKSVENDKCDDYELLDEKDKQIALKNLFVVDERKTGEKTVFKGFEPY